MAWNPKIQIIQSAPLVTNLLNFITNNQVEAFKWANSGNPLKPFAAIYNSAQGRVVEIFPSLLLAQHLIESETKGDLTNGTWKVRLEVALEGSDSEKLTNESLKYRDALESMLANIENELTIGSINTTIARASGSPITVFDEVGKNIKSQFTQVFNTTTEFELRTNTFRG